jgi:hypothetical protein
MTKEYTTLIICPECKGEGCEVCSVEGSITIEVPHPVYTATGCTTWDDFTTLTNNVIELKERFVDD